jgi:hypothetical protein
VPEDFELAEKTHTTRGTVYCSGSLLVLQYLRRSNRRRDELAFNVDVGGGRELRGKGRTQTGCTCTADRAAPCWTRCIRTPYVNPKVEPYVKWKKYRSMALMASQMRIAKSVSVTP